MNISGVVVQTRPEHVKTVRSQLEELENCILFYQDDKGRIIVTIEGETLDEEMNLLKRIQAMSHVVSAEMSYSFSEEDMDALELEMDPVEKYRILYDENVKAEEITYRPHHLLKGEKSEKK